MTEKSAAPTEQQQQRGSKSMSKKSAVPREQDHNEAWAAEAFARQACAGLRYSDGWLRWDGQRWTREGASVAAQARAKEYARSLYNLAAKAPSGAAGIAKLANRLLQRSGLTNLLLLAANEGALQCDANAFDADPDILNVANGILDLKKVELLPHAPEAMCTKLVGVAYDPEAKCPRWEQFIEDCFKGDPALSAYVQKMIGYGLTGHVVEQVFAFMVGGGSNGKSTFVDTIASLLGDYATKLPAIVVSANAQERNSMSALAGLAELQGRRFCYVSELPRNSKWNEETIKSVTGDGTIKTRRVHGNFITFTSTAKLFIAANHEPKAEDDSDALWRRFRVVRFLHQVPEDRRDPFLMDKLRDEQPGILTWCVEGLRAWRAEGLRNPPLSVTNSTNAYRNEEDSLGDWIRETFEGAEDARLSASAMYESYSAAYPAAVVRSRLSKAQFARQIGGKLKSVLDAGYTEVHGTRLYHVVHVREAKGGNVSPISKPLLRSAS